MTATRSKDVSFNQLEEGSGARIRYRKVSDITGDEVPADKIVRGYEVSKGKYVLSRTTRSSRCARRGATRSRSRSSSTSTRSTRCSSSSPTTSSPTRAASKPYKLLTEAMTDLNKVAIGRIVMRSKERLVAIRPLDGMLCIETMRYADEVVARDKLMPEDEEAVELTDRERTMAQQLVESLASDKFDASKYHDEYREQLLDLIERKAAGEEIVAEPEVEAPAKVLDLVAALEASLAKASTAKDRHPSTSGRKVDIDADDDDEEGDEDEAAVRPVRAKGATAKAAKATKTAKKAPAKKAAAKKRSA